MQLHVLQDGNELPAVWAGNVGADMDMPETIYAERDPETNEKRWYSTKGMGVAYVKSERVDELEAEIKKLKEPWTHTDVYDEGYQAGFLDGQEKLKR